MIVVCRARGVAAGAGEEVPGGGPRGVRGEKQMCDYMCVYIYIYIYIYVYIHTYTHI